MPWLRPASALVVVLLLGCGGPPRDKEIPYTPSTYPPPTSQHDGRPAG